MKRLLCVWLPNWPIQRLRLANECVDEPEQDPPPTLLWRDDPRRGRLVMAACATARNLGAHLGMPIAQASEICTTANSRRGAAPVRVAKHELALDDAALQQLAVEFQQRISPLVAIETLDDHPWAGHPRHQSESLLCEITGVAHLFGGEAGLLEATADLLASHNLSGPAAIAESVGAAWAVSHYGLWAGERSPAIGKRCFLVPTGATRQQLEPLPVEALRLAPETVATLSRLGVKRIEQLLRLPRSGLAPRLGTTLIDRIQQALGEVDEPLCVYRPESEHVAGLELEYATTDLNILADRVQRLTDQLRAGLATRQRGALRLTCRLDLSAHPPLNLEIGLFAPTLDAKHLSGLLVHRLENQRLPSSVVRLTLSVTLTGPLRTSQVSLFAGQSDDFSLDPQAASPWHSGSGLSRLIDSLSGRLGRDAVLGITIDDDPLPENAYSAHALAGNQRDAAQWRRRRSHRFRNSSLPTNSTATTDSNRQSASHDDHAAALHAPSPHDAMRRPLCLLSPPVVLAVALDRGPFTTAVSTNQLPDRLRIDGRVHTIIRSWGPERIETGWWKGPAIRRDYYRVESDQGQWWWIFCDLVPTSSAAHGPPAASAPTASYRWLLHGRFG